jgi:prepilin-type N-terminal cleavage/methylation domain-containing protein
MMRNAVTLVELLFVIVLLAVLSSFALTALPKNQAISDAKHILTQINQTRFAAQGNQAQKTPLYLDDANLSTQDYELQSENISYGYNLIEFDWTGKVYANNTPIPNVFDINITSQNKTVTILIFPVTGYAKIK